MESIKVADLWHAHPTTQLRVKRTVALPLNSE